MITHEQYLEYKRLVDEYEEHNYIVSTQEAEDDYDDEDDCEDNECDWCGKPMWQCNCEAAMNCTCGAYTKSGAHIADCICGAG